MSGPLAAEAVQPTAETLTVGDFMLHMSAMQAHYSPGGEGATKSGTLYRLPALVTTLAVSARPIRLESQVLHGQPQRPPPAPLPVPVAITQVLQATQRDTLAFVQSHQQAVTKAIQASVQATAQFVQQMQALEQKEIADHAARIDALFRGLIAAGKANPSHQAMILVTTNHTGLFLAGLLHSANGVAQGVAKTVSAAAHAAANVVHDATKTIGDWASGAAQSVGSFFKSLF
jgi:hypothetical protein